MEKQRKKRIREREKKYNNSISSKKSKKSTKSGDKLQVIPAVPTLPNVDLYAGEKKQNNPWLYQHAEEQNSFYYDNQPMTSLESSYSLQRNPTNKYSPYNGVTNTVHQPAKAYMHQDNNYYYPSATDNHPAQYSNTIATPAAKPNNDYYSAPTSSDQQSYKNLHVYDSTPATPKSQPPHTYDSTTFNTNNNSGGYQQIISNNSGAQLDNTNYDNYHYSQNDENVSMVSGSTSRERQQPSNSQQHSYNNGYHYDYYYNNDQNAGTRNGSSFNNEQSTGNSKPQTYTNYV